MDYFIGMEKAILWYCNQLLTKIRKLLRMTETKGYTKFAGIETFLA